MMDHSSDSQTMPRSANSTAIGARKPWRPRVSGIVGFIFGPIAAALVTFVNFRRLDQPRKGAIALWLTILGSVLYFVFIPEFEVEQTEALGNLIGNLISPFLFPALQRTDYKKWETSHSDEPDNGWAATGWGVLGLVLFFAISIAVQIALQGGLSPYGQKLGFNGGELYYTRDVEETDAKSVGNLLVEQGFFDGSPISVQLTKAADTYQFRMVIKPGFENKPEVAEFANAIAELLSSAVFQGNPVEVHITDDAFETLRKFPETIAELLEAAEEGHAGAQTKLGDMYRNGQGVTQDYAKAIRWYRDAIRADPGFTQAHLGLARAHYYRDENDLALVEAEEAVRLAPESAEAHYLLGKIHRDNVHRDDACYDRESVDAAVRAFEEAVRLSPASARAQRRLSDAVIHQGRYELGVQEARRAVEIEDSARNRRALGKALLYAVRPWEAAKEFRAALRHKPDDVASQYDLAFALLIVQRYEEAVTAYEKHLELTDSPWIYAIIFHHLALRHLDRDEDAQKLLIRYADRAEDSHERSLVKYLAGALGPEQLWAMAGNDCERAEVDFYVGYQALLGGRTEEARRGFESLLDANYPCFYATAIARQRLEQLGELGS